MKILPMATTISFLSSIFFFSLSFFFSFLPFPFIFFPSLLHSLDFYLSLICANIIQDCRGRGDSNTDSVLKKVQVDNFTIFKSTWAQTIIISSQILNIHFHYDRLLWRMTWLPPTLHHVLLDLEIPSFPPGCLPSSLCPLVCCYILVGLNTCSLQWVGLCVQHSKELGSQDKECLRFQLLNYSM